MQEFHDYHAMRLALTRSISLDINELGSSLFHFGASCLSGMFHSNKKMLPQVMTISQSEMDDIHAATLQHCDSGRVARKSPDSAEGI